MLAVRDGDLVAFEQLVRRHQSSAWKAAYRLTGDAHQAEDLAQEGFLRLLDTASRYRPTASFRTYFFRILTRLHIDRIRKKGPHYTDRLPDAPDGRPMPDSSAMREDRDSAIQAALAALPPRQRSAVVLRYFEGLSGSEIAAALEVSAKAVERLLARARKTLESRLAHFFQE